MRNPRLCECLLSQRNVSTCHDYLTSHREPFCEVLWKKFSLSEGFLEGKLQIVYVIPGKIIIILTAYPLGYESVAERILEDLSRNWNYHKLVVVVLHSCITKNVPALNHVHPLGSISRLFTPVEALCFFGIYVLRLMTTFTTILRYGKQLVIYKVDGKRSTCE